MENNRAILLINTGSPENLTTNAVRRYLNDFLTDRRIMNIPSAIRVPLVKGIIAPLRAKKSRNKYALIWQEGGSPLQLYTESLARKITMVGGIPTFSAMRYSRGSLAKAYQAIAETGTIEEVVLVPLFPHYAMSSYESAVAFAVDMHNALEPRFTLRCVAPYYNQSEYISVLVEQILNTVSFGDHLVFSYHGIPIKQTMPYAGDKSKDYPWQCEVTAQLVMSDPRLQKLSLTSEIVYQSRFGNGKWLSPTLEDRLARLPDEGKKKVAVLCPSFVCDCLETLWEIKVHASGLFKGEYLKLIPCPNDSTAMANAILRQVERHTTEAEYWTKP